MTLLMSVANSIQDPLKGIIRAEYKFCTIGMKFDQRTHQENGVTVKQQRAQHH
jgi:hypothetical protein